MAYTPDPANASQPTSDVKAGTAAAEFRALKAYIATLVGLSPVNPLFNKVAVCQAVQAGPVDANGFPAYGGVTGLTSVTTTAISAAVPLVVTASQGFGSTGAVNLVGISETNLAWTGLTTNGQMYLYVDVVNNTLVPGSGTLVPAEQIAGAYSVVAGQHTYNIVERTGKVGSGAAAAVAARVYVGEVTVAGGVVTVITWYALNRSYFGAWVATLPGASAPVSATHNIASKEYVAQFEAECTTNDNGYVVGDRLDLLTAGITGTFEVPIAIRKGRLSASIGTTSGATPPFIVAPAGGGVAVGLTAASWKYRFILTPKYW